MDYCNYRENNERTEEIIIKRYWETIKIEKMLTILQNLERYKVVGSISSLIFIMAPEVFQRVYSELLRNQSEESIELCSLLEPDLYGLTRLHKAIFNNETTVVDQILPIICRKLSSEDMVTHHLRTNGYSLTSAFAACGDREVCSKMLCFLKDLVQRQILSQEELEKHLSHINNETLYEAFAFRNVKLFQMLLKLVKDIFGQDVLITNFVNAQYRETWGYCTILTECDNEVFFKVLAEVVEDYECLNTMVFQNKRTVWVLEFVEPSIFQKMLDSKGTDQWIKRLFGVIRIDRGLRFLARCLIYKFNRDQRRQFVNLIVNDDNINWFIRDSYLNSQENGYTNFTKIWKLCIAESLEENNQDEMVRKAIAKAALNGDGNFVHVMLSALPLGINKDDITKYLVNNATSEMLGLIRNNRYNDVLYYGKNTLQFVVKIANKEELSQIVDFILIVRDFQGTPSNIWNEIILNNSNGYRMTTDLSIENVQSFLECVSEKLLDENRVKDLVTSEDNTVITRVLLYHGETSTNAMLNYLSSDSIREEVVDDIVDKAPRLMKDTFFQRHSQQPDNSFSRKPAPNWMHVLQFVVDHTDNKHKLLGLVEDIIEIRIFDTKRKSIWSDYLYSERTFRPRGISRMVDRFLKCVREKLDECEVEKLVRHVDGKGREVTFSVYSNKQQDLVKVLLKYVKDDTIRNELIRRLES